MPDKTASIPKKDVPKEEAQHDKSDPGTDYDQRYKHEDLRIKRRQLRVQIVSLIVAGLSLIVAGLGFLFVVLSLNNNARSLGATVQNNMLNHVTDLNKLMQEEPWAYPYFYENKPVDPKDPHYQELLIIAMHFADVLDIVTLQSSQYKNQWQKPEAWDRWTCDTLERSPILRQFLREHLDWYGDGIKGKFNLVNSKQKCK